MRDESSQLTESIISQPERHIARIPEIDGHAPQLQWIPASPPHPAKPQRISHPLGDPEHQWIHRPERIGDCPTGFGRPSRRVTGSSH